MHYINRSDHLCVTPREEPQGLIPWLHYSDSLTDKLKTAKGCVNLTLCSQGWIKPTWWDKYFLSIQNELIFQREIIMESQGTAYWYARTIIPQSCYELDKTFFKRLEHESIRNLIFESSDVRRVQFQVYPIDQQHLEFYWLSQFFPCIRGNVWVRLAEFSFQNKGSFYLAELLLPELEGVL